MRAHTSLLRAVLASLLGLALSGCNSGDDSLVGDVKQSLNDLKDRLDAGRQEVENTTTAELEKLHRLEYKVIEIDGTKGAAEIEKRMAELGDDRWDCFHVQPVETKLRLFCKRNPKTFLKYIPRVF